MALRYDPDLMMYVNVPDAPAPAPVAPPASTSGFNLNYAQPPAPAYVPPPAPAPAPSGFSLGTPTPDTPAASGMGSGSGGSGYSIGNPLGNIPSTAASPTAAWDYTPGQAIDPAVLQYLQAQTGQTLGGAYTSANGYHFAPGFSSSGQSSLEEGGSPTQTLSGFSVQDDKPWYEGQQLYKYDANGQFVGQERQQAPWEQDWVDKYGPMIPLLFVGGALAAAGAGAGAGAAGAGVGAEGGAAGAAGVTGFGDAGAMYAGLDAGAAGTLGGGASVAGGSALGGGLGAGALDLGGGITMGADGAIAGYTPAAASELTNAGILDSVGAGALNGVGAAGAGAEAAGTFNPAVDSQLANTQLGITGTQAAQDAAAAAIPSVTVNGAPTGNLLGNLFADGVNPATGELTSGLGSSLGGGAGAGGAGDSLIPGVTNGQLLGGASTVLGGLGGEQSGAGGAGGAGGGATLDPRLEPYLYGDNGLLSQTQSTLNTQQPLAQQQAAQMAATGSGLLNQPIAGNGYGTVGGPVAANGYGTVGGPVAGNGFTSGAVTLNAPTTATNPYLGGMADDIGRRTQQLLGQNNLGIQSNFVGSGGLGGTRQGIAQGTAAGQAADSLQGQLAGLYGNAYNSDQNRALQQYQADQAFYGNQRGQDLAGQAQDQNFYTAQRNTDLAKYGQDQSFYANQRGQDLAGAVAGGGLLSQSQQQAFGPLTSASSIYKPYTGLASSQDSGTNWQGLLGGALQGATFGHTMGWW